jgi:hypothetical protein
MAKNPTTSVRFTDAEEEILQKLKDDSDARSRSEVVRRSVAQAAFLLDNMDDSGYITIKDKDGNWVKLYVKG